jgi:hypothetical protein
MNPYLVLGVGPGATAAEIEDSYRPRAVSVPPVAPPSPDDRRRRSTAALIFVLLLYWAFVVKLIPRAIRDRRVW